MKNTASVFERKNSQVYNLEFDYKSELEKILSNGCHYETNQYEKPSCRFDFQDATEMSKRLISENFVKVKWGDIIMWVEKPLICFIEWYIQNEMPIRTIKNVPDFYVSKYLVSNVNYEEFDTIRPRPFSASLDNSPATWMSYWKAIKFVDQLNKKTSMKYRLPTEPEYVNAAAPNKRLYSYKESGEPEMDKENIRFSFINEYNWDKTGTLPVDSDLVQKNIHWIIHACWNVSIFAIGHHRTENGCWWSFNDWLYVIALGGNFRQCKHSAKKVTRWLVEVTWVFDTIWMRLYHSDPFTFINS